jgi:nucleoside-diphosphate-sugar epimerase
VDGLIGHTGYVGQTLLRQRSFDRLYRSTDIHTIRGAEFDLLVVSGAPAQKWIADRDPEADLGKLSGLVDELRQAAARQVVLVSTVDVFADSRGKDEASDPAAAPASAYGRNRLWLEDQLRAQFADLLVVRLPGLVGPGLRKNAVFDFRNDNNLAAIDARGVYQFYPMVNFWADLQTALTARLDLVHLTAAPVSIAEVARQGFGRVFDNRVDGRDPAQYDFRSRHAALFGGEGPYQYSRRESLLAIRAYAQSEPAMAPLA